MRNPSAKTRFFCGVGLLLLASFATGLIGAANSFAYDDGGKKPKIVFVTSAGPGNPFYGPIIKGFEQAGKDLGVDVIFRRDQKTTLLGDAPEAKRMIAFRWRDREFVLIRSPLPDRSSFRLRKSRRSSGPSELRPTSC